MGRMSGAAGFKRDSVASRGGKPDPGLTGFSYNDPNATPVMSQRGQNMAGNTQTSGFGMNDTELPGSGVKQASPMSRSFTNKMAAGGEESKGQNSEQRENRPPIYVPSKGYRSAQSWSTRLAHRS